MKTTANPLAPCPHPLRPVALGVALALICSEVLASAPPGRLEPARVARALGAARASAGTDLAARAAMVNPRKSTIVHATQQVQGHRVWGAEAVVHADTSGRVRIAASSLREGAQPAHAATLTKEQAVAIARKALGLKGASFPPRSELVVFPTRYRGDIKFAYDPQTHQVRLDRANSVIGIAPTDPYVWAWEVEIFARNAVDGIRDMKYVVDARTGAVLRVDTCSQTLAPANPPLLTSADVPATGAGRSQYSGTVPLSTTQRADGTFMLVDQTRGTLWNPWLHDSFMDANGDRIYGPDGNPVSVIGLQTLAEMHEGDGNDFTWTAAYHWFDQNPTNTWGDGTQFVMYPYGGEASVNGQTAAVDAHWGMATTWDFYKSVFGRNGVDDLGTSLVSEVHVVGPFGYYYDNAFWNTFTMGMFYSDGTGNVGVDPNTGGPTLPDPAGGTSLTAIDIIGHEMTHGVTAFTSGLVYDGESGGINESTSDFMGSMVEAWSTRPAGTDSTIPDTGTDWLMGARVNDTALRSMINPASDGVSPNWWYSGIEYLDVHYASGPMNRFFYFLSQGASGDAGSPAYSPYLPGGMVGVGNDKAAHIWYTAMTEYLTPVARYEDARVAGIAAATELYGDGSAEVQAVINAFAAINVGGAGGTPRVSIRFSVAQPAGGLFNPDGGTGTLARVPIVAMGTTVHLSADVRNTDDTSVTWKVGGMPGDFNNPGFRQVGGKVDSDGNWTPDDLWGFHSMTVVSNADPLEFAEGAIWVVNGDADADNEFDAIDMGAVALSWGLYQWASASHSIVLDPYVDSFDVQAISQAFKNAYGGV